MEITTKELNITLFTINSTHALMTALLAENAQGLIDRAFENSATYSTEPGYVPVPEPTSMALLALGVTELALKRPKYINNEDVKVGDILISRRIRA